MRVLLSVLVALACNVVSFAQPVFKFQEKKIKFKEVKAGPTLGFDFEFENKGNQPLIITDIKVACTCTKVEYPKAPVKPAAKGTIHVTFDTTGKFGWQYRTLEIYSNSKNSPDKVQFIGKVLKE